MAARLQCRALKRVQRLVGWLGLEGTDIPAHYNKRYVVGQM